MKIKFLVLFSALALLVGFAPSGFCGGGDQGKDGHVVVGTPAPGSKFSKIQIGMYSKQIRDLIGQPTDEKSYMTGKAWIPFHEFAGDNYRMEDHYKGEGVLTFAGGGAEDMTSQKLIRITVDPNESGYVH